MNTVIEAILINEYCYWSYYIPSQGTPNCSISVTHNHLYKQIKNK